ncbi:MAG TPA: hypothetical protein GX004_01290 [Firmicutes bacterium]|jgi:hypothetical protein|nr:hypothetical protein [Bacillota bacterium]
MQTLERIIITKNLDFHLEGDKPEKVSLLLKAVKKALDEIKKEKPFLTELNISELSFLPGKNGEIMLKVYFE